MGDLYEPVNLAAARARLPPLIFESVALLRRAPPRVGPALKRLDAWVRVKPSPLPLDAVALWLNSFLAVYEQANGGGGRPGAAAAPDGDWAAAVWSRGFNRAAADVAAVAEAALAAEAAETTGEARAALLVYGRLAKFRGDYGTAARAFRRLLVTGPPDRSLVAAAALCEYYGGHYGAAIGVAVRGRDAALAHRFYLFHDSSSTAGSGLRRAAAADAAHALGRTLVAAYPREEAYAGGSLLLGTLGPSPTLACLGPNPILYDDATVYAGGRGERAPFVPGCDGFVVPAHYAAPPGHEVEGPAVLVPCSKPGNYYHCLLEYVGKVAALTVERRQTLRDHTFLVPGNQCMALYAEALKALGIENWRPVDPTRPTKLPRGCAVLDVRTPARVESAGLDAGACAAAPCLWDFYTPPRAVPRALRAAFARFALPYDAAILIERPGAARGFRDGDGLYAWLDAWTAKRGLTLARFAPSDGATLAEQSAKFGSAALVVAAHGAGLANLAFAPPGCRVLEFPLRGHANKTYSWLAHALDLPYRAATSEALFTADVDVDLGALDADLDALFSADACACPLCRGDG